MSERDISIFKHLVFSHQINTSFETTDFSNKSKYSPLTLSYSIQTDQEIDKS